MAGSSTSGVCATSGAQLQQTLTPWSTSFCGSLAKIISHKLLILSARQQKSMTPLDALVEDESVCWGNCALLSLHSGCIGCVTNKCSSCCVPLVLLGALLRTHAQGSNRCGDQIQRSSVPKLFRRVPIHDGNFLFEVCISHLPLLPDDL